MDNIGDWLYIVLLIVAGVSGLFKSGKKEQEKRKRNFPRRAEETQTVPRGETSQPRKDFWEILEEMTEEQPRTQPRPAAPAPASPQARPVPQAPVSQVTAVRHKAPTPIPQPTAEETGTASAAFANLDELKKAVVWHEILDRKF